MLTRPVTPTNRWETLDKVKANDCLAASRLVEKALLLLGLAATDCGTQVSYASSDATGDANYPSDVTDQESDATGVLIYTDNLSAANPPGPLWNNFEGSVKAKDGATWKYWTVVPNNGPFIGTGPDDTVKDKSARYQILDKVRNDYAANICQRYNKVGASVPLP